MIRLLIAFLFLAFSSVSFASKTYYYYSSTINTCSAVPDTLCTSLNTSDASMSLTYAGQYLNRGNDGITCGFNRTLYNYYGTGQHLNQTFSGSYPTTIHGVKNQIVCQDSDQFVLEGCNAKCVPDPCALLTGQVFSQTVACGTVSCASGGTLVNNGSGAACSKGGFWRPEPLQSASKDECSGTLKPMQEPNSPYIPESSVGASSSVIYCTVDYTYTGGRGNPYSTPSNLTSLFYSDAIPTTENGTCPANTVKGQFGAPDPVTGQAPWYCIPDNSTPNQCTAPKIKDNNGQCVDPKDAAQCQAGQVRDASGACVTPNPNGGGSGDSGGSGSGGSGDSGGTGGTGGTGGNNDGSNSDPNSLPEKTKGELGSGSKATASTAEGCTTAPPCSGDPLQCAAFVQDWKQNCQMMSVSQGDADKANTLATASNNEFKQTKTQQEQKVTGFFNDFKTSANASTTSQCPNDINLPVMGKSITLKLSQTCDFWRFLRILIIASAYLAAARIVFGSLN